MYHQLQANSERALPYQLRNADNFVVCNTNYGKETFKVFVTKLINEIYVNIIKLDFSSFKFALFSNFNFIYEKFNLKTKTFR